ncbi:hypothetical protein ACFC4S_24405 [Priestia megaterium]|uniref:hypothetical protein n=1 Tax=Priestia megaterium TaxID=1404 RepID=UPI001DCB860D|nr:hypothetical protein [Priestia megaterium]
MIELLLLYKWWIIGICEATAWIATYFMFRAKIVLKSNTKFRLFGAIAGITGYGPHFGLGIYNYFETKKIDLFLIVIAVILVIGGIFWRQIEGLIEALVNKMHNKKLKKNLYLKKK